MPCALRRISESTSTSCNYIKTPPDADTLRAIIAKLEDEPTALVRRDSMWKKLGLTDDDARDGRSGRGAAREAQAAAAATRGGHRRHGDRRTAEGTVAELLAPLAGKASA